MIDWYIFRGTAEPHEWVLPEPPPWRRFAGEPALPVPAEDDGGSRLTDLERARAYQTSPAELELINVALFLRRPLLITGRPGTGKSTLAYAVARELGLGPVLRWPITSRSSIQEGLYRYDAIGRLQDANLAHQQQREPADIGQYLQLGPLGTALLPYERPRVLLIDEVDKSDIDLPNDLLNVFEEGEFTIPELVRQGDAGIGVRVSGGSGPVTVSGGVIRTRAFPLIIMTSNGERDFPPAFLRRCVRLELTAPTPERLARIVEAHLGADLARDSADVVQQFLNRRDGGDLATDQLLNAVFLTSQTPPDQKARLTDVLMRYLGTNG
ncbi:ATPase AAA [Actinoplanes italicus]|uniref:Dynein-related subfamily AAA family protein n=1 Tax=Actinoplanes italicus TaxID=113567 RepID=A0A2T0JZI9_9ACTN|nr:MoxR family ATPase [Actinoplanes italicus]PRX15915.1 dynein-related subfamily AAA family protein [Actinoplanes italicus]GIE28714.1 ATPase AAA [Actinoplanes italicus]